MIKLGDKNIKISFGSIFIKEAFLGNVLILNSSQDSLDDAESEYAYGIQWNKNTYDADPERIGNLQLHKTLPVQSLLRGCLLNDDGEVVKYLNPDDWTGETLDGSLGQVMVEIPEFYWKFSENNNGIRRAMISMTKIDGYTKVDKMYISAYEATIDRQTTTLASVKNNSARYRGGNNSSSKDNAYNSQLMTAATNFTMSEARSYARKRKQNSVLWNCNTYISLKIIFWLFSIEYANFDCLRSVNTELTSDGYKLGGLGNGITNADYSTWNSLYSTCSFVPIGHTDSLGNNSGEISYNVLNSEGSTWITTNIPRYRGIENPFGNIAKWTDGIIVLVQNKDDGDTVRLYTSYDPNIWNDSDYSEYLYIGNCPKSGGYIGDIHFGENGDITTSLTSQVELSLYKDFYYTTSVTSTTTRPVSFGGLAMYGAQSGILSNMYSKTASDRSLYYGTRLVFIPNV